ncbi:MAG: hydroxyethylthiazole kinase [Gammaproteobacteria bacterium RIFCSPHIGHO2_12_FULL_35_23]|nr:MAG: hydroxyethylthiazole kinase [Gammaproteobacteria bacterium RIFCSPHIGHO2_12_FULL_35_23]
MFPKKISPDAIFQAIKLVKQRSPLVHNITNFVVMQTTANILLAVGASPIMANAIEEMDDIVSMADALVINIGTLYSSLLDSITKAQDIALQYQLPVIFDPVGAGASKFRTETAKNILNRGVSILRGNASEILSLQNNLVNNKGVDSCHETEQALEIAIDLSNQYNCCVVISGHKDIICYKNLTYYLTHGTPLLTRVTGMGCSATALIGAFAAVVKDLSLASIYAMATLGLAAEKAEKLAQGPGSFYPILLDTLYKLELADFVNFHCELA